MKFVPYIQTSQQTHQHGQWVQHEAMRHYVRIRRALATPNQVVNVFLRGPRCADCQASDPFDWDAMPSICYSCWEEDVAIEVGEKELERLKRALARGDDPAWSCVRCHGELRPWAGDDVYIVQKHLEAEHSVKTDTGQKKWPSQAMRAWVLELYENRCFGCGAPGETCELTIDHIIPRSHGGDAAFRNLQPLCSRCQQKKANSPGEELDLHDDLYFEAPPGDSYEGLFW